MWICIAVFISFYCSMFAEIPEPYRSINDLAFDGHGWFGNGPQLESIFAARSPNTVIEVGCWLGLSTRFMASRLPNDGILYAIDTWRGSPNESVHMQDPRLPMLFQLFLSNVKHANLTHKIIPIRMESMEAAAALKIKADLIYLDAAHDTPSVINDIMNWHPHLNPDGFFCGDDWLWDSVREAVLECAPLLNKNVNSSGNFWWYE